ncbi:MAG: hypothetical protein DRJ35_06560 [Thermoprotei archaeon]|nr:MAG: hypothetical protein DRJ35_06560 [Thermoprotei archaeon]
MKHKLTFGRDIQALLRKLILRREEYFSNDKLNTEGRKIFEETARMLIHEHPYFKPIVKRARRTGSLKDVLRIAELVLGRREVKKLILSIQLTPYRETIDYEIENKLGNFS